MPLGPIPTASNNVGVPISYGDYSRQLSNLDPILALPSKRELFDVNSAQVRTYNSKQETFNEESVYLGTSFEGALFETPNTFITEDVFPFRRYDDINFRWDMYNFPLFPAVRTAQLAPPVKLGFERREGSATMSRYALSVEGLTEDQRTNLGKTMLTGLISSMAHGFLSMFELNGFRALFRDTSIYQKFFFEAQLYDVDPTRKLFFELSHFDQLRRGGTGFQDLTDSAQQEARDTQQLEMTYAIIPPGARSIFAASPEMRFANMRGAGSQSIMDLQGNAPELQNRFAGVQLLVARPYYFDGAGIVVNPMRRDIIIGDFGIQDNVVDGCEPSTYRTSQVEPSMFSVNDNKFVKLSIEWLLRYNQRFDHVTGRLRPEHAEIANENYRLASRLGIPVPDYRLDMFVYHTLTSSQKVVFDTASHWGQMEQWALTDHVIDNIGKTSAYQAAYELGEADYRALERGLTLKAQIRAKEPTALDLVFARAAAPVPPPPTTADGRPAPRTAAGGVLASRGSMSGAQALPTRAQLGGDFANVEGYLPYGYGTIGGLLTIADEASTSEQAYGYISLAARQIANDFAPAYRKLKNFYKSLYTDQQVATDARYVPAVYRSSDLGEAGREMNELLAFGYNVIDEVTLPVYLQGPVGAATERTTSTGAPRFENIVVMTQDDNGDSPYEAFRTFLPQMLDAGAPLQLQEAFGTLRNFRNFEERFNVSRFGDAYKQKLADDRARAASDRAARSGTRTMRITPSTVAETMEDDDAAALRQSRSPSLFIQFQENEVVGKDLTKAQRIWSRVVDYVNKGTAPVPLTNANIAAWAQEDNDARQTSAVLGQGNVPPGAYLTRLSVPYEKLAPGMYLASPLNDGQVLAPGGASSVALAALKKNSQTDIDVAPVFSLARGGLRTQAETVPAAAQLPASGGYFGLSSAQPTPIASIGEDVIPNARGTGSSWLVVNENLRRRWLQASRIVNIGERIGRRAFLLAPITHNVCKSMAEHNVTLPFAHLMLRPNKRYTTQAIVYLSMSAQTPIGFTATHDPRVHYVMNGTTEKFFIHTVLYTETVNMRPERVMIVPDALVTGYRGGDSLEPFTPQTFVPDQLNNLAIDGPSVIVVMQPAGSLFGKNAYLTSANSSSTYGEQQRMFGSMVDIRGYLGAVKAGRNLDRNMNMDINSNGPYNNRGAVITSAQAEPRGATEEWPMYLSALYTNYIYNFRDLRVPGRMKACKFTATPVYDNTVCLQARQKFCTGFGSSTPTAQIAGRDHFADSTEDGSAGRRMGIDNKPYSDIYKDLPILVG